MKKFIKELTDEVDKERFQRLGLIWKNKPFETLGLYCGIGTIGALGTKVQKKFLTRLGKILKKKGTQYDILVEFPDGSIEKIEAKSGRIKYENGCISIELKQIRKDQEWAWLYFTIFYPNKIEIWKINKDNVLSYAQEDIGKRVSWSGGKFQAIACNYSVYNCDSFHLKINITKDFPKKAKLVAKIKPNQKKYKDILDLVEEAKAKYDAPSIWNKSILKNYFKIWPPKTKGSFVEVYVKEYFKRKGYSVENATSKDFDAIINGIKKEIKAASLKKDGTFIHSQVGRKGQIFDDYIFVYQYPEKIIMQIIPRVDLEGDEKSKCFKNHPGLIEIFWKGKQKQEKRMFQYVTTAPLPNYPTFEIEL